MRTEVWICFHGNNIAGGAQAVLGPAGCGPDVATVEDVPVLKHVTVVVTLDASDPRLSVVCRLLEQHGEDWLERREDIYTEEELTRARLIVLQTKSDHEVFGGPRVGTKYDMTGACPVCGAGARQKSAQMIAAKDVLLLKRSRAAATYYDDILVNEKLAAKLAESGILGLSFQEVCSVKKDGSRTRLTWKQLCARHTLPPMSARSTGIEIEDECPRCGRSGFAAKMDDPPRLVYSARDLEHAEDVNVTWEWFGDWSFNGKVSEALFAYPWMLVTPKVWRIFRDAGVNAFRYLPIRVDDSGE